MWDRCTVRDIYNLGYGAETKCGIDVQIWDIYNLGYGAETKCGTDVQIGTYKT
jgi:hypothetical protein